jgi:hypothetical protein
MERGTNALPNEQAGSQGPLVQQMLPLTGVERAGKPDSDRTGRGCRSGSGFKGSILLDARTRRVGLLGVARARAVLAGCKDPSTSKHAA